MTDLNMDIKTLYNKTISMKPIEKLKKNWEKEFDLCFYVYQGKLTTIVEKFNHQDIKISIKIVKEAECDHRRNAKLFKYFLIFANI